MVTFTKMHGCGNDYIYIDCFSNDISKINDLSSFIQNISDRHFGVGSDGVILITKSEVADVRMIMYNADGSEGAMCGNGIRCVGKYSYEHNICRKQFLTVETKSGIKELELVIENDSVTSVCVDMGIPSTKPSDIPVLTDKNFFQEDLSINNKNFNVTCVSMGNPHAVIFLDDIENLDLENIGPKFENHSLFPDRINTEFLKVIDSNHALFRVWERGSGETFACGTGACASVVAGVLKGIFPKNEEICISLKGGDLYVTYRNDNHVILRGNAVEVFEGKIEI